VPSRFAQFCRRHSIDELPQVVNVLTGPGRLASSEVIGSTDRMRELERGIHFALLWRHRGDRIKRMLRSKILTGIETVSTHPRHPIQL
jgi:hypothetical protein